MTIQTLVMSLVIALSQVAGLKVIDMSYTLSARSMAWPIFPPFSFTILNRGKTPQGFWMEINSFDTPEHKGTHLDAPCHFHEFGWRTHQIPASNLVGPAAVVDISHKAARDPDYLLSILDIQEWEDRHGALPDNAVVLMNSGWSRRYPDPRRVFNTNNTRDPSTFHFPGIDPALVVWLAMHRDVVAMAVDVPSVDRGQNRLFETHQALGQYGMVGVENVANMGRLPPRGALVVLGVVKLLEGSGGPARVFALLDTDCHCAQTNQGSGVTGSGMFSSGRRSSSWSGEYGGGGGRGRKEEETVSVSNTAARLPPFVRSPYAPAVDHQPEKKWEFPWRSVASYEYRLR